MGTHRKEQNQTNRLKYNTLSYSIVLLQAQHAVRKIKEAR